jgi:hypothetical protein
MPSSKDSILTVRASSHCWKNTVTISQSSFPTRSLPTSQRSVRMDAHWVSFSTKKRPVASRSQMHACNYPFNALAMGFSTKDVHGAHDHLV